jgi:hypothetical protein
METLARNVNPVNVGKWVVSSGANGNLGLALQAAAEAGNQAPNAPSSLKIAMQQQAVAQALQQMANPQQAYAQAYQQLAYQQAYREQLIQAQQAYAMQAYANQAAQQQAMLYDDARASNRQEALGIPQASYDDYSLAAGNYW